MVTRIDRKLCLTASLLGAGTRKELAAAFRRLLRAEWETAPGALWPGDCVGAVEYLGIPAYVALGRSRDARGAVPRRAATSPIGYTVPTSLFASITLTSAVSVRSASATEMRSLVPRTRPLAVSRLTAHHAVNRGPSGVTGASE